MSKTFNWCIDKTRLDIWDKPVFNVTKYGCRWFLNGVPHRENGPAIEYVDGAKRWYLNGKWHRENGPAIENANGDKRWYLNGTKYSESDYWKELNK